MNFYVARTASGKIDKKAKGYDTILDDRLK